MPVMISDKTPWQNLEEKGAGWVFYLNEKMDFERALEEQLNCSSDDLKNSGEKARKLAEVYLSEAGLDNHCYKAFSRSCFFSLALLAGSFFKTFLICVARFCGINGGIKSSNSIFNKR